MRKPQLDSETADRMLAGEIAPADAPPGFQSLCGVLAAARGQSVDPAVSIGHPPRGQRTRMITTLPRPRRLSTALASVAALAAMSGAAYAAGLPGAASGTADGVLRSLDIAVPGPSIHAGQHPDGSAVKPAHPQPASSNLSRGDSSSGGSREDADSRQHVGRQTGEGKGKGAEISTLARTTTATGAAKGAEISAAASDGKSHAGQNGHQVQTGHPSPPPAPQTPSPNSHAGDHPSGTP